ncbi:MAG TPA: DUF3631 domain-containing protein [Verrucomicrobiae bacterium]|jgi:putative DNA primase/helicase|nr:DUF3631 domain-containing protein [Verrucomicrobiae bacterium]
MKNQTVIFETVAPHPEPVVVGDLLTEIEGVIKKHVVLGDHAASALAVWVLHTYVYESRDTVAYVAIESPEKRCGKTTLLSVLAAMVYKPLIASNITVSALFRAIDILRPTLFIDEADTFLAGNGTIRGIINSGNTWRTAYVLRMAKSRKNRAPGDTSAAPAENSDSALKRYNCWCPKVIAMIGQVPDTIADRSIVVMMTRKLVTETRAPLAELNTADIRAKCARFALDATQWVTQCEKIRGEGLNDRAADTFDPLYVIARLAGREWEQKLQTAAFALSSHSHAQSPRCELLMDILSIFILTGQERFFSSQIAATLRDGAGFKSFALKYSAITEFQICKMLRPYGIRPRTIRMGGEVNKGYHRGDFRDALRRYVPNAEREAWIEEIGRRADLGLEAKKAAREEAERAEKRNDESFMAELFEKLKKG